MDGPTYLASRFQAFAHRGGDEFADENSLQAFQAAYELGYRYLETDVHVSRDGVLMAFHDADLQRLLGEQTRIDAMLASELQKITLPKGGTIPTLSDLLEQFPDAYFNIDAKAAASCQPLAELINQMGAHKRVCIGAFQDHHIRQTCRLMTHPVCRSMGQKGVRRFFLGAQIGLWQPFTAACVQLPMRAAGRQLVSAHTLAYAHRRGLKMHVWTVNDESQMNDLLDMGVDGIMTDKISTLKRLLQRRNLWINPN